MTRRACSQVAMLALALACPTGLADAQDIPSGVYRARTIRLELRLDGRAVISGANGPLSIGAYRLSADTIVLREESGPFGCGRAVAVYTWRVSPDTLHFRVVQDPCGVRRTALALPWSRVDSTRASAEPRLQAVVISAERQAQDAQRSPVSLTVLPAETMRRAVVTRPQDLSTLVPGLQIGAMNGGSALTFVRGVGNLAATSLQDPTVTFNYDGVYMARPTSAGGLYYDLERVEVLKGPQGTLYGRNATGGAVNILPHRPALRSRGGELSVAGGNLALALVDGWFNAPLGDRAAIRVAGQRVRHGAYLRDGSENQDDWAGRVQVRLEPNDAVALRIGADYFDQGGLGTGATPLALGPNRFGVASHEGSAYYETRRVAVAGRNWPATSSIARWNRQRHGGLHATLESWLPIGAVTIIPAVRRSDIDASNTAVGNAYRFTEQSTQQSLEVRVATQPARQVRTLLGLFAFEEDIDHASRPFNQFQFTLQRYATGTSSLAPFGRITWDVADNLRATVGARYTWERKTFTGSFESFTRLCPPVPNTNCPNAQPFPADIDAAPLTFPADSLTATPVFNPADGTLTIGARGAATLRESYARLSWRTALEYDLTRAALLYGSYETGFKSGGFFFSSDAPVYGPEHVGALTVGLKSHLVGYRLRANVELFDWQYRDQQISKLAVDSRGVQNIRTENIGRASIRGLETEIEYAVTVASQLSVGVQYLDARYDDYVFTTTVRPVTGCNVTPLTTPTLRVDCSGRRAPYAPQWTVSLGAGHATTLPTGTKLTARVGSRYQSETLVGLDFLQEQQQAAHWLVDATVTLDLPGGRYSLEAFGRNLTDRTVVSNTFVVPFSTRRPGEIPFVVGVVRPPRVFGIRVNARN